MSLVILLSHLILIKSPVLQLIIEELKLIFSTLLVVSSLTSSIILMLFLFLYKYYAVWYEYYKDQFCNNISFGNHPRLVWSRF